MAVYTVLVKHGVDYKKYDSTLPSWQTVTSTTPTETDYLNGNTLTEISSIPESAWQELIGAVELSYYTDDTTITEAEFEIETEPFVLYDELDGKDPKVVYYTDDTGKDSISTTIETEPFTFYEEMGNNVEVMFYTDDSAKTSASLEITANYSPLDEISGEFDVVTWTNAVPEEVTEAKTTSLKNTLTNGETYSVAVDLSSGTSGVKMIDEV